MAPEDHSVVCDGPLKQGQPPLCELLQQVRVENDGHGTECDSETSAMGEGGHRYWNWDEGSDVMGWMGKEGTSSGQTRSTGRVLSINTGWQGLGYRGSLREYFRKW